MNWNLKFKFLGGFVCSQFPAELLEEETEGENLAGVRQYPEVRETSYLP